MSTSGGASGGPATPVSIANGGTAQTTALAARGDSGLNVSRALYILPQPQSAVANLAAAGTSLFSLDTAPASLFPANTLAVGDVVRIRATGELFNNSGGAAVMSILIKVGGQAWSQTQSPSIASAATSTRTWIMDSEFSIQALGAFPISRVHGYEYSAISAANARTLVIANVDLGDGFTSFDTTVNAALDVLGISNVSNAATTATLKAISVEKVTVG